MTECLTNGTFPLRDVLSARERGRRNVLTVAYDLNRPETIPATETEKKIDLAERVLEKVLQEKGHHTELAAEMKDWRREVRDDHPKFRRALLELTPRELNFGQLDGEEEKKAAAIIKWATDSFGNVWLDRRRGEQLRHARNAWRKELEEAHEREEIRRFKNSPPKEYNGWVQIEVEADCVVVAYEGSNHGKPSVAVVFEDADGEMQAQEFLIEKWEEADGDPQEARHNRPIKLYGQDSSVWGDFKRHLNTFDVEPLQDGEGAGTPVTASA